MSPSGYDVEVIFRPHEVDEMSTDSVRSLAKYLDGVLHDPALDRITISARH